MGLPQLQTFQRRLPQLPMCRSAKFPRLRESQKGHRASNPGLRQSGPQRLARIARQKWFGDPNANRDRCWLSHLTLARGVRGMTGLERLELAVRNLGARTKLTWELPMDTNSASGRHGKRRLSPQ
jgi:hypothetical protein